MDEVRVVIEKRRERDADWVRVDRDDLAEDGVRGARHDGAERSVRAASRGGDEDRRDRARERGLRASGLDDARRRSLERARREAPRERLLDDDGERARLVGALARRDEHAHGRVVDTGRAAGHAPEAKRKLARTEELTERGLGIDGRDEPRDRAAHLREERDVCAADRVERLPRERRAHDFTWASVKWRSLVLVTAECGMPRGATIARISSSVRAARSDASRSATCRA